VMRKSTKPLPLVEVIGAAHSAGAARRPAVISPAIVTP
jgi:hypothetical protein